MKNFEYARASSVDGAIRLSTPESRFLAGGIDLLGEMKEYIVSPRRVIDLKLIPGLDQIDTSAPVWTLGANVTIAEIAKNQRINAALPGLAEAALEVGSPQIRNVATLGGNLAQHSRCWYYRHRDLRCLKRGGSTCYAREGENKYHSLFSGNPCISPIVSNLAVILAALDAKINVRRGDKELTLTIGELYFDAWNNPLAHNSLLPGDLIVHVEIPTRKNRSTYLQVSEKSDFDWALVSCAAAGQNVGDRWDDLSVFLGAVAPIPYRVESPLLGSGVLSKEAIESIAESIASKATPLAHNGYRVPIAQALIRRALTRIVS
ncbi:MAG TPA: FAD binding domain-containing protein [Chthoniobacterales bacterium]|nr:FAD binding domain-containing protein [Chthoniobacterales bacterium]